MNKFGLVKFLGLLVITPTKAALLLTLKEKQNTNKGGIQCPSEGGEAVWSARVLYCSLIDDWIYFENACDDMGKHLFHYPHSNQTTVKNSDFKLYPNPNDGNMTLEYNITETGTAMFSIYDITGKVIKQQLLNVQNKKETINAEVLNAGV